MRCGSGPWTLRNRLKRLLDCRSSLGSKVTCPIKRDGLPMCHDLPSGLKPSKPVDQGLFIEVNIVLMVVPQECEIVLKFFEEACP